MLPQMPTENSESMLFSTLPLQTTLIDNLRSLSYEQMTPIQAQSLPWLLQGKDIIAQAKTGSGKTAAFGLSILHHLIIEQFTVQALVLCPTRELAEQVAQAIRRLARTMPNIKILNLSGGIPVGPQIDSLRHGGHIIVGTPGRIQKHLDKGTLSLKTLKTLVLDEADRMLDMGFLEAIQSIISACPKARQTLLFSATYPNEIKQLCQSFMQEPRTVKIDTHHAIDHIEQRFYEVSRAADKFDLLKTILLHHKPSSTLIFCNMKQQAADVATALSKAGFSARALHGDMEQPERDEVIVRFINQSCLILVATDVAARGIDIEALPMVINYDVAFEQEVHTHRIGRTGRAGHKGLAISLTLPSDAERLCAIESHLKTPLTWGEASLLKTNHTAIPSAEMVTLSLDLGRKNKIRPGDILGALTKDAGLPATHIGKINIAAFHAYVAIHHTAIDKAYQYFQTGTLKGKNVRVRKLR